MNCRISSIGGCAPYTSSAGMFRSSMKNTCRLVGGGPKTPRRRRSSLLSITSCIKTCIITTQSTSSFIIKSRSITIRIKCFSFRMPPLELTTLIHLHRLSLQTVHHHHSLLNTGLYSELLLHTPLFFSGYVGFPAIFSFNVRHVVFRGMNNNLRPVQT